jgi:hypothetical protein
VAEEPVTPSEPPARRSRGVPEPLNHAIDLSEETAQRLVRLLEHSQPLRLLRGSTIASAVLGTMGFALFVVGIEKAAEDIPVISNPYGSIGVGLALLAATGLLIRRLAGRE